MSTSRLTTPSGIHGTHGTHPAGSSDSSDPNRDGSGSGGRWALARSHLTQIKHRFEALCSYSGAISNARFIAAAADPFR
jgi:hypothetical protein